MTTITREQLRERAREKVKSLEFAVTQTAFAENRAELEEELELARIALASLEAEPYGYVHKAAYEEVGSCGLSNDHEAYRDSSTHIAVYTAPPAPVVPEDISNAIETLKKTLVSCHRYNYCSDAVKRLEDACRAAMLQGSEPVSQHPELTVWYGSMPETNGKANWTAMLHRKGQHPWGGITIDCSEHPDRVRYEADRMRHLIGELSDEPDILAYDADAHSGYVEPVSQRYTLPDGFDFDRFNDVVWLEAVASNPHMHSPTTSTIAMVALELNRKLAAGNSPVIPDGWVMVPKEPTVEMINSAMSDNETGGVDEIYELMLAVAPKPQLQQQNIPDNIPSLRDAVGTIRRSGIEIDGEKILSERDAINSPVIPDGWQLVPKKITLEMECALSRADSYDIGWQWALAAAPQQEGK